jgi:hypothetical protein
MRTSVFLLMCILGIIALASAGCSPHTSGNKQSEEAEIDSSLPPTDKQYKEFARSLEEVVRNYDLAGFNAMIDWDAVFERAIVGLKASQEVQQKFVATSNEAIRFGGIGQAVINQVANGGTYRFVRLHALGEEKRILVRLFRGDGTVVYHDFIPAWTSKGKIKIVEIYFYGSGEYLSETIRKFYLPAVYLPDAIPDTLSQNDREYLARYADIKQMTNSYNEHQYEIAEEIFAQLPQSLQNDKRILRLRLTEAGKASQDEHDKVSAAFRARYPDDPCLYLMEIDYYAENQEYDRALQCIDSLDKAIGGDPCLDVMRANMYLGKNDLKTARDLAQKAIGQDGNILQPYRILLTVSLERKNYSDTALILSTMRKRFGSKIDNLIQDPLFEEYLNSTEYSNWMRSQR